MRSVHVHTQVPRKLPPRPHFTGFKKTKHPVHHISYQVQSDGTMPSTLLFACVLPAYIQLKKHPDIFPAPIPFAYMRLSTSSMDGSNNCV